MYEQFVIESRIAGREAVRGAVQTGDRCLAKRRGKNGRQTLRFALQFASQGRFSSRDKEILPPGESGESGIRATREKQPGRVALSR